MSKENTGCRVYSTNMRQRLMRLERIRAKVNFGEIGPKWKWLRIFDKIE